MSTSTAPPLLVRPVIEGAIPELALPALLLHAQRFVARQIVSVYVPSGPTVAFTARDARSPRFDEARQIAQDAGFGTAVRAPGGRFVAYDEGAVVVDHVTPSTSGSAVRTDVFSDNADQHVRVIRELGGAEAAVGELVGEYCPGEHSINMAGQVKVVGSAQRVTGAGALFSTVVQVHLGPRVRDVIAGVSDVLGYPLALHTVGGLADFVPHLSPRAVAAALSTDYALRLGAVEGNLPDAVLAHARASDDLVASPSAIFRAADWARDHADQLLISDDQLREGHADERP